MTGLARWLRIFAIALIPAAVINIAAAVWYLAVWQPRQQRTEQRAEELFDAAARLAQTANYHGAVLKYLQVLQQCPESEKCPLAVARVGDLYLEQLGELPRARYSYQMVQRNYPAHPAAAQVAARLAYIDKVGDSDGVPFKLLTRAKLDIRRHRAAAAAARLQEILVGHPACGVAPEVLLLLAELYAGPLADPAAAQQWRTRLDADYPSFNLAAHRPF